MLSSRKSASPTKRRLSDVKEEPKSANANADGPHAPPVSPSLPSSDAEHNLPEEPEVAVAQTCQGDCQQVSRPEKDPGAPDPQDVEANDLEKGPYLSFVDSDSDSFASSCCLPQIPLQHLRHAWFGNG